MGVKKHGQSHLKCWMLCVSICVCTSECTGVQAHKCMYRGQKSRLRIFHYHFVHCFLRQGFQWTQSSPFQLHYLVSKTPSAYLCPHDGVKAKCYCACLFFLGGGGGEAWGSELMSLYLQGKHFTLWATSPFPNFNKPLNPYHMQAGVLTAGSNLQLTVR